MDIRTMSRCALMTAVIAVLAPISIPLTTMVPVSLATLAVMLAGVVLGPVEGLICTALYLVLGMIGVPVFAGYAAGIGVLAGVSGGYLIGYLPLAYFSGLFSAKADHSLLSMTLGMVIGTVILYVIGTVWFIVLTKMPLNAALLSCVVPFLGGDALKILAVCLIGPRLRAAVQPARNH